MSLGIAVHKRYAQVAVMDEAGEIIEEGRVRRNADDLLSVAADKTFHNWYTKFYALGVEPLILRGSRPLTKGHNVRIRAKGYSQRWISEISYSTTKRSLGDAVRALG